MRTNKIRNLASIFKQILLGIDYVRSRLMPTTLSFQKAFNYLKNTINTLSIAPAECAQWFHTMDIIVSAIRKSLSLKPKSV